MKKRDEIHFWQRFNNTRQQDDPPTLLEISRELNIPYKRARYLALKWERKGLIEYGVAWRVPWITPRGMSAEIGLYGFDWDESASEFGMGSEI